MRYTAKLAIRLLILLAKLQGHTSPLEQGEEEGQWDRVEEGAPRAVTALEVRPEMRERAEAMVREGGRGGSQLEDRHEGHEHDIFQVVLLSRPAPTFASTPAPTTSPASAPAPPQSSNCCPY